MGQDPKPSKRRGKAASSLPLVRGAPNTPVSPRRPDASVQAHPHQARIQASAADERAIAIPGLHNTLEQLWGASADGYFKAIPDGDERTWWLTWRWRLGEHAGHYVMVRVLRGELAYGMSLLAEKVMQVRGGLRRPTRDRYEG